MCLANQALINSLTFNYIYILQALLIHVVSYTDKISFVLSTDEDTIHDPHSLCDDLEESLKLIKAAAVPSIKSSY